MCGRFTLRASAQQVARHFGLQRSLPFGPRYNIAPGQPILVVRVDPNGNRELVPMRWGFVPPWSRSVGEGPSPINARAETVATHRLFRHAFASRRCLIPADGFYEWKPLGRKKQPYYICRRDAGVFAMAGLWERWSPCQGEELLSCTILTVPADPLVGKIHPRMPLILTPGEYPLWLTAGAQEARLHRLLRGRELGPQWTAYPVSPAVNHPQREGPELIRPWDLRLLPGL